MRGIVNFECSQVITQAFRDRGHEFYSNDIKDCEGEHPEWHLKMDAFKALELGGWDIVIAHPPCTYLAVTGNKWYYHPEDSHLPFDQRRPHPKFPDRRQHREKAKEMFMSVVEYASKIGKYCIENPVGIMSTEWRKPTQIIQPMYFGHNEPKKTCLWLRGLPRLNGNVSYALDPSTCEADYHVTKSGKRLPRWYAYADKSKGQEHRAAIRSRTFEGIAKAMAHQWG